MSKSEGVREKAGTTDASKMLQSAKSMSASVPGIDLTNMPPVDIVGMMARSVAQSEYATANDMAVTQQLKSKADRIEAERKLDKLEKANDVPSASPVFAGLGGLGGIGGLGAKTAMLQTILNALPEDKRASWIENNKDFIMSPDSSSTGLLSQFTQSQTKPAAAGGSSVLEAAALITAMGEEQRQNQLMNMKMAEIQRNNAQPPAPASSPPAMEMISFMQKMMDNNNTMMQNMTTMFTTSISKLTDQMKDERQSTQSQIIATQRENLEMQRQMQETQLQNQLTMMNKELESVKSHSGSLPPGIITLNDLPKILEQARMAGMNVQTQTSENALAEREYELRRLELEHRMRQETRGIELEQERVRANSNKFTAIAEMAGKGLSAMRIEKAIKSGGSSKAQRIVAGITNGGVIA